MHPAPIASVGGIDRRVSCRLQFIMPQAKIMLRRRNLYVADSHLPPPRPWSKETRRSGFFEMKSLSNRRCKENPGLINGPSDRAPPPNPEVNRCLKLRWALHRARVGVVGPTRASDGTETKAHRSLENSLATAVILRLPRFSSIALRKMLRTALTVGIDASPPPVCTV
jgi:hypothetical protein